MFLFLCSGHNSATKMITCRKTTLCKFSEKQNILCPAAFFLSWERVRSWSPDHFCLWKPVEGKTSPNIPVLGTESFTHMVAECCSPWHERCLKLRIKAFRGFSPGRSMMGGFVCRSWAPSVTCAAHSWKQDRREWKFLARVTVHGQRSGFTYMV